MPSSFFFCQGPGWDCIPLYPYFPVGGPLPGQLSLVSGHMSFFSCSFGLSHDNGFLLLARGASSFLIGSLKLPRSLARSVCFSRVQFFVTPWSVAHQAPLSMGFCRQEYWSGLPFPSPGDLPNPGIFYIVLYICQPQSPSLSHPLLPI